MFGPVMRRTSPASGPSSRSLGTNCSAERQDHRGRDGDPFDLQDRLFDHLGPAITLLGGEFGQTTEDVDLRQNGAGLDQAGGVGGHPVAEGREEFVFESVGPFLGVADLVLILLSSSGVMYRSAFLTVCLRM